MRGADFHLTPGHLLGTLIVIAGYALAGGVVAFLVGSATLPRHALAYGLGWQGLIGGYLQGRAAADQTDPHEP